MPSRTGSVRFHTVCADGVYFEDDAGVLRFVEAPPPPRAELEEMLARIYQRVMKWLKKRRLLRAADDSHEERDVSPPEDVAQAGIQRATLVTVASDADDVSEVARPLPSPTKSDVVIVERFNL
jgi:hypothetical protein